MAVDLIKYGKTSASLKKIWLEQLASLFLKNQADRVPSDLQGGIIGYTFDVMANITEDLYFQGNTLAKEVFPAIAKFSDSIYAHAFSHNITDIYATPAYIEVLMGIKVNDIYEKAIVKSNLGYRQLTLGENTRIYLDKFEYYIDYPIDIIVKPVSGSRDSISAKFNLSKINPFSTIQTTFVESQIQVIGNDEYFIFKVPARQYSKIISKNTVGQSRSQTDVFDLNYIDELAGFNVIYKETLNSTGIYLDKIYQNLFITKDVPFCYYRLDEDSIRVSFSSHPEYFYPRYGSEITIEAIVTKGTLGNFNYRDDEFLNVEYTPDQNNEYEVALQNSTILCQLLSTKSSGGLNKKTVEDIRKDVIEMKSSRQSIISDIDLQNELSKYQLKVKKMRDDILRREFATYILLKNDDLNYVIPSRNAELLINNSQTKEDITIDAKFVEPYSVFNLWLASEEEHYNYNRFQIEELDEENMNLTKAYYENNLQYIYNKYKDYSNLIMICPFMIKIFKDPYIVGIYDIYVNKILGTIFEYNDTNSPEKFSILSINVDRTDLRSNKYKIWVDLGVSDIILETFKNNPDTFPIKIKVEMLDDYNRPYCYTILEDMEIVTETNKIRCSIELETDNFLYNDDFIKIVNKKIMPIGDDVYYPFDIWPEKYPIPFKTKLKAHIVYLPDVPYTSTYKNYLLTAEEETDGYIVTDTFQSPEILYFVKDISNVFSPILEVIMSEGIWPKYEEDIYMTYQEPVYELTETGEIALDPITNLPIVLHEIGEIVLDTEGEAIILHNEGDDIISYDQYGKPIYEVEPEVQFIIKNMPLVSLISMMYEPHKKIIYETIEKYTDDITLSILPRLVENNRIIINVYNTVGTSSTYIKGYKNLFTALDRIDMSLELNIKLYNNDDDIQTYIRTDIIDFIQNFIITKANNGYLYIFDLIVDLKASFPNIEYVEFSNMNGNSADVQTIKINSAIDQDKYTPEYITINQKLDELEFINFNNIVLTPNININFL